MNSMENGKNASSSKSSANSHAGHRERLRDRAAMDGAESLKPHELIELLLFYAIPRRNVNALAHELDRRFGGVAGVLAADEAALAGTPGVGRQTARLICALGELCASYADLRSDDRPMLGNLQLFRAFARRRRKGAEGEESWQFCLTCEGRLLLARPIAPDAAWAEPEYLRQALEDAISSHAHSVLLAQYLDRPCPEPSDYDRENTRLYGETLARLEVQLLDHLLVGTESVLSMRERGDMELPALARAWTKMGERYMGPPLPPRSRLREDGPGAESAPREPNLP